MNLNNSIVVIPVYKDKLSKDEQMSLCQCATIMKNKRICIVCPEGLNTDAYSVILSSNCNNWFTEYFPKPFFNGISGYNHLMLDSSFYKRFSNYEYILIYQLDAWVFSDELDYWCAQGYDYIGAPWIKMNEKCELEFAGVGNGGFSLRRIQHFIDVLSYRGPVRDVKQLDLKPTLKNKLYRIFYAIGYQNTIEYYKNDDTLYEDIFLSIFLSNTKLRATMPDEDTACLFSFEKSPSFLFSKTNKLPFGCHAWRINEYDTFWNNYIK